MRIDVKILTTVKGTLTESLVPESFLDGVTIANESFSRNFAPTDPIPKDIYIHRNFNIAASSLLDLPINFLCDYLYLIINRVCLVTITHGTPPQDAVLNLDEIRLSNSLPTNIRINNPAPSPTQGKILMFGRSI